MTENEAIKEIRHEVCNEKGVSKRCHDRCMYRKEKCAYSMAIEALEEVMKYRELGTIEELKDLKDGKLSGRELAMIAVDVNKLKKYQAIGTVEECREARERQRGKNPILRMNEVIGMFVDYAYGRGEYKTQMNNWWRCPCCNEIVGERVIVHKHIHDQRKKKFCEKCGQAIDWYA